MFKIILAIRYLVKRRITYLAVLSVALCVFVVVVVMTVMTGLVGDFKVNNHDWVGDCVVSSDSLVGFPYYEDFLEILEGEVFIEAASPVIRSYGILTHHSGWNDTVEIMGLELKRHCRVTNFGSTVYYHKNDCLRAFEPSYDVNLPGCVLGIDRAIARDERGQYHQEPRLPMSSYGVSCFPLTARGALAKAGLSIELAEAQEARLEEGMSFRVLGEIQLSREDYLAAEHALLKSLEILNDLSSEYQEAKTKVALARLGRSFDQARSPYTQELSEAIDTLDRLGASADLQFARELLETN